AGVDRGAIEGELHDVGFLDAVRRAGSRQQVVLRVVGMPRTDVAERIDDSLTGENAVGGDNLLEQFVELGHWAFPLQFLLRCHRPRGRAIQSSRYGGTGCAERTGGVGARVRGHDSQRSFVHKMKLTEPSVPSSWASI